jgi:hypothetical protein
VDGLDDGRVRIEPDELHYAGLILVRDLAD